MVEPEMAFYTLSQTISLGEELLHYIVQYLLKHGDEELAFLEKRAQREWLLRSKEKSAENVIPLLRTQLQAFIEQPLVRITYTKAIELLQRETEDNPKRFVYPVTKWGCDLQREHETFLTRHFQSGVVVTHYPKEIKAFYMHQNEDGKTVDAMDVLLPDIGEVMGGSARETRIPFLKEAMLRVHIDPSDMEWYLDTRRFGSVPHSGFGLGLERFMLFVTGMENIRDVIPFPRTPGHIAC